MNSKYPEFELELPDRWSDSSGYTFAGPEEDGLPHNLLLTVDQSPNTDDVCQYARIRVNTLKAGFPTLEIFKEEPAPLPNGAVAYDMVYSIDQIRLRRQCFILRDGVGFTFTIDFSRRTIKTLGNDVDKIIRSLKTTPKIASNQEDHGNEVHQVD